MKVINSKKYIKKNTIKNDKVIGGSRLERIEASSQSRDSLVKAAAIDIYYQRILNLNDM